ncbi:hypothetical protein BV20DRAFT_966981 [Pilatotrama ljubarskyi]|nr:hypothetical protein BV20DRAFT_966981 [Pilatotrama ljubarskyi]
MPPKARKHRGAACRWLDDHIDALLDKLLKLKSGFGQGSNPQKADFQSACDTINEMFDGRQNIPKTKRSVQDKWAALRAIYIGLLAWDTRSGMSYDDDQYGCGVDDSMETLWQAHLSEHKAVSPYRNMPWKWFKKMESICGQAVAAKGGRVFSTSLQVLLVPVQTLPVRRLLKPNRSDRPPRYSETHSSSSAMRLTRAILHAILTSAPTDLAPISPPQLLLTNPNLTYFLLYKLQIL